MSVFLVILFNINSSSYALVDISSLTLGSLSSKIDSATTKAVMMENISELAEDGLDYTETEYLTRTYIEELREAGYKKDVVLNSIESIESKTRRSNIVSGNLRKMRTLISMLCSLSTESCNTAVNHLNNVQQKETKDEIKRLRQDQRNKQIEKDIQEVREVQATKDTLKTINSAPAEIINNFHQSIRKWKR